MQKEKSTYTYKTRTSIRDPSGYQHVKLRLRKCKDVAEVMKVMFENEKCEDVQVGTAAIKTVKLFHENKKVSRSAAMKQIDKIWGIINEYVVGMNVVAYNEYFHACEKIQFNNKCRNKFDNMIKEQILPNRITLYILLNTCRKSGDTDTALYYWNEVVNELAQPVDEGCWASFLAVCAKAKNVQLAEKYFEECPTEFKNLDVCFRMMSVYKHIANLEKVLMMKEYMEEEQITLDVRVYNDITATYRKAKQYQQAINVAQEAIAMDKWNVITVNHLFEAKIASIKATEDHQKRIAILGYIESEVVNYFTECGETEAKYASRMLDAYVSTYPGFGSRTFEECCSKYNFAYWEDAVQSIPTLNMFGYDYNVANAVLKYVFDKEFEKFRGLGLNIIIHHNIQVLYDSHPVSHEDVNMILSSFSTPLKATQQEPGLLYCEQTKNHDPNDDDLLW